MNISALGGFQFYQLEDRVLSYLGYYRYRGSGPDPGEVALKTASTSKDGSRREKSPMTTLSRALGNVPTLCILIVVQT